MKDKIKKTGYAAVLTFNKKLENMVYDIWNRMRGFGDDLKKMDSVPHVTLAIFPEIDHDELIKATNRFVRKTKSIPIRFGSFGSFATKERVLFLSPVPTTDLLKMQKAFYDELGKLSKETTYKPGLWIPHCTIAMNIPENDFPKAVDLCLKIPLPISGKATKVEIFKFMPVEKIETCSLCMKKI